MSTEVELTPEVKAQIAESSKIFADMREEQKSHNAEMKKFGEATAETANKNAQAVEALTKSIEKTQKAIARQSEKQAIAGEESKALEIVNRNLKAVNKQPITLEQSQEINAIMTKMIGQRSNSIQLTEAESKSINGVIDPAGGYFMMPFVDNAITKKAFDARGFFNSASNLVTGRRTWMKRADMSNYADSRYRSELKGNEAPTDDDRYKEARIDVGVQYYPEIFSREFLEDDELNLQADVLEGMRLGMIRKDAQGAISGLGTNKDPMKGILSYEDGAEWGKIERITSTDAGAINLDDILKVLPDSLKEAYHENATFTMARQMYNKILTLKDGQGRYLFDRHWDLFKGAGLTLFNYDVLWDAGMANSVVAGAQPIFFGDNRETYQIVTRLGFSLHKDDSQAETVKLTGRSRIGGGVKNFESLKVLQIKA